MISEPISGSLGGVTLVAFPGLRTCEEEQFEFTVPIGMFQMSSKKKVESRGADLGRSTGKLCFTQSSLPLPLITPLLTG